MSTKDIVQLLYVYNSVQDKDVYLFGILNSTILYSEYHERLLVLSCYDFLFDWHFRNFYKNSRGYK